MLQYSVRLNELLIPVTALENTLARYTEPLIVWNHDDIYSCSIIGSSIAVRYRERFLLLCSRHQLINTLAGRPFEDVGLLDKDGHSFCSAGGIRHFEDVNDTDLHDSVVFDFTIPCAKRPMMRERFFNLAGRPPYMPNNQVVAFVVSGFPSQYQNYEMNEQARHLDLNKKTVVCVLAPPEEQSVEDQALLRLKPVNELVFDPDGMSGGAVFVMQLVDGESRAYLAGMTVRAGNRDIHIVKIEGILDCIDSWITES